MLKRLTAWLSVSVAVLPMLLVGCNMNKKEPAPPAVHQPGEPVSYETLYYTRQGDQKTYYASDADLKLAIARTAARGQTAGDADQPK